MERRDLVALDDIVRTGGQQARMKARALIRMLMLSFI